MSRSTPIIARHSTHAQVPDWVFGHELIRKSRTVLHIYIAMFLEGNYRERTTEATWEQIAERTGLGKSTIYRDIAAMREAGLIIDEGDNRWWMPGDNPERDSTSVEKVSPTVEKKSTTIERTLSTELDRDNRESNDIGRSQKSFDTFFADLWDSYDHKIGRKAAERAVRTRLKTGAMPADLMLAAKLYAASRVGQDPKFTKYASTFFGPDEPWREWLATMVTPSRHAPAIRGVTPLEAEAQLHAEVEQRTAESAPPPPNFAATIREKMMKGPTSE